jgi:chorismate lyase/3-hydroxybenzoate synthase
VTQSTAPEQRRSHLLCDPIPDLDLCPPRWVDEALGPHASKVDVGPRVRAMASGPLVLLTTTIALALEMPAHTLRSEVALSYQGLERSLVLLAREPIRFWNYIPSIGDAMGDGLDRYMVFNSGRYDAFAPRRRDGGTSFDRPIATASAVGVGGRDLVVHCLASDSPGSPVENPLQISSWRYSARYGPMPPCFSRATIATLGLRRALLIGGTASIVGEQSMHRDDAKAQMQETLRNIGALVAASGSRLDSDGDALGRIVDLRVYATSDRVADVVRRQLAACCPNVRRVEIVRARMCRPELLLEIEGVAEL